jgi:molybdopterin molybdotransferase
LISVHEASARIAETLRPGPVATLPLLEAQGRILAERVTAGVSLPSFDNSAMDGYAVHAADLQGASAARPVLLPVAMEAAAGAGPLPALHPGTCCRIMTGGPMPPGADAVVKIEESEQADGKVRFVTAPGRGEHVRFRGEDLREGDRLLEPGTRLTPSRLALLAAIGRAEVTVHAAPRVAILTTGNELVAPGQPLQPGQIYDSNAIAMAALVAETGAIPVMLGVVRDDRESTRRLLEEASSCDVVMTSGGVSMGAYDYVSETLRELGEVHFERVAQQPGKPLTYATLAGKPAFGLPGNPVSTRVCFEVYVRPALRRLMGHAQPERRRVTVTMKESCSKRQGLTTFLRAVVTQGESGLEASLAGAQGSAMLKSMARANALLWVPAETSGLEAGERVEALMLDEAWEDVSC